MAGSVNKVILIGHLGKDPEARHTQSGDLVVSFSVATSESWKDKTTGERKERTDWHNVVIFNEGIGKFAEQYLKKGSKVFLEGKLQTRKYTDREGQDRYMTEVVLARYHGELQSMDKVERQAPNADSYGTTRDRPSNFGRSTVTSGPLRDEINDDIPF